VNSACSYTSLRSSVASIACALGITLGTATTHAQPFEGTGTFRWEASLDDGATWQRGSIDVPREQASLQIRGVAEWFGQAIGGRFALAGFDGTWTSPTSAGRGDTADSFVHIDYSMTEYPIGGPPVEQISGQRQGDTLKIDDSRDTFAPGLGPRSIAYFQDFNFGIPNTANPMALFQFRLTLDGSVGERTMDAAFRASTSFPGMNPTDRFLVLRSGASYFLPLMTRESLRVNVIPAPGGPLCAFALAALFHRRRHPQSR
jgi:hypothetical protein